MTWEETIIHIRQQPEYANLVEGAYLGADIDQNFKRFLAGSEFEATLALLSQHGCTPGGSILDLGAGNGISSASFAKQGYTVTALEPDPSNTVGAGAIRQVAEKNNLHNLKVVESWGEDLPFPDQSFDLVYGRQVMHHAYDLDQFVASAFRVLKPGGLMLTVRDHVLKNDAEKDAFLAHHPLQKYYGGENAFTLAQYTGAFKKAGFQVAEVLSPSQSPINYSPWDEERVDTVLQSKIGPLKHLPLVKSLFWKFNMQRLEKLPGRLYSILGKKG